MEELKLDLYDCKELFLTSEKVAKVYEQNFHDKIARTLLERVDFPDVVEELTADRSLTSMLETITSYFPKEVILETNHRPYSRMALLLQYYEVDMRNPWRTIQYIQQTFFHRLETIMPKLTEVNGLCEHDVLRVFTRLLQRLQYQDILHVQYSEATEDLKKLYIKPMEQRYRDLPKLLADMKRTESQIFVQNSEGPLRAFAINDIHDILALPRC